MPARITYLPRTGFVLGVEKYVGNIPQINMYGIKSASREYNEIYSNNTYWVIACLLIPVLMIPLIMKL